MAEDSDLVMLRDRFEIKPGTRLSQFDQGSALAYAVEDHSQSGRKLFALICPGTVPCRGLHLPERRSQIPMLWPEASGVVDWPVPAQGGGTVWGRRPVLVYPQPTGERMLKDPGLPLPTLTEQLIARNIIKPAMAVLKELGNLGVAHRAIRPSNIFYALGNSGEIVFGECFATPPGCDQPTVYETVENGLAHRMGRAEGSQADDLYALGVLVLFLHMGNPLHALSDEQVTAAKINFGTFSALAGGEKVSPTMAEMLRGLLSDKVSDRWTLKNLEMWMLGQYFNPVLPSLPQRATRPIRLGGGEHMSRPAAANAMAMHWDEALVNVDNGTLESWLKRGFNDEKVAEPLHLIKGLSMSYGPSTGAKHRMVSRLIQFMGPNLPICYKSIRVSATAMGNMLAAVIDQPPLRTEFVEMLRGRLPQGWLDHQPKLTSELTALRRTLDGIEKVVERPGPGYSVERVLYDLDPAMPCRSELIGDYYVTSLKDLLPAIDAALPGAEAGTLPMDRHIAAFIAAKIARPVERELTLFGNPADQTGYRMGVLRLLAAVQRQHPSHDLPRLAETLLELMKPVVDSFHRIQARSDVRNKLEQFAAHSDFVQMAELLDEDGALRQSDIQGFEQAQQAYAELEKEAQWLEAGGLTDPLKVQASARVSSAITSAFIASGALAAFTIAMVL
ncbi:protein kinase family protein [Dongia sp. agr-C8]